jgi:hypothetical protein
VQASPSSQRKLSGTHSPSRQMLSTQGLGGPLARRSDQSRSGSR